MSNIKQIDISKAMKIKYLDYAMSVIMGRALPDVRDGFKWVHRRIIFSMDALKLYPDSNYRKSARIVGDVLGKYHPHGDTSVYDALVRMAQDFSLRYKLIDGHGNWGSQDGDNAAAYRYTEAKMDKIALELLKDINKNTVDFIPNFDGQEQEPSILPSRFPNLLVNGSEGIAVGVATAIPPHNLSESINTVIYHIDNPDCSIKELVEILKAPDFPTGGEIINPQNMIDVYTNGYGKIIMRAKYHIEDDNKSKNIIITEIPYQVNKSKLLESLFILSNDTTKTTVSGNKKEEVTIKAKIPDISEIIDESDRNGMRINIKLKKNVNPNKILPLLFKYSNLQYDYNANFTAIYKTNQLLEHLNLKQILQYYIEHQKEVLTRRTQFDLNKSLKRLHILEGLRKSILNMDKTIELIRNSKNKTEAKNKLIDFLEIDEEQANSILDLKLQRLTGLEIETIQNEYDELIKNIEYYKSILNNEEELLKVLKTELIEIRDKYGDERRTQLIYKDNIQDIAKEDLIEDYNCKIIYTNDGYIKKLNKSIPFQQHKLKDNDQIIEEIPSTNKSTLLLFTNKSNRYKLPCYELDVCNSPSKALGEYFPNILDLEDGEQIIKVVSIEDEAKAKGYICSVFENGKMAKVDIQSFISNNKKLQNCYAIESNLLAIDYIQDDVDIFMLSQEGKGLIINSSKINSKSSRNTKGNIAMNLGEFENNKVIKAIINPIASLSFTLKTEKGKEKSFFLDDVAPTNKENEERSLYAYIQGKPNNQGNFILNCRTNNDKIVEMIINK